MPRGGVAAFLAVIVLACLTVPGAQGRPTVGGLIRIFAITTGKASIDQPPTGWSPGDELYSGKRLETDRGKGIGYGALQCVGMGPTLPGHVSLCRAVYVLPLGKIIVMGSRQRADFYVLAIVGGTGIYSNDQGTMTATTVSLMPRRERLLFSLE